MGAMSIISNKEELLESDAELRGQALEILEAGYSAIDTEKILKDKIKLDGENFSVDGESFSLKSFNKIIFIGIGKCALDGAKTIEGILGDYLTDGIALDVKSADEASGLKRVRYFTGTHPYPSEINVSVTGQILEMIRGATEKDLIITLISGGGSSLFCLPNNISVETLIEITKNLTQKGANIFELNTVRKHLSGVQGGQLTELCYPAKVISLIFSDVLGDDISMIASGPTVIDKTTVAEATQILSKYDLLNFYLPSGKELKETPKDPKYFEKVKNILVVSNKNALEAMKTRAEDFGFETSVESQIISGYANQVGKEMVSKKAKTKSCLLFGGETTVKISGNGVGGRNQEMALAALSQVQPNSILVCAASDGWDNTDHAGAIADTELFQKAKKLGVSPKEYLENSDSYNFFKKVGGAIYTGKLGSNVSDLYIMLYK